MSETIRKSTHVAELKQGQLISDVFVVKGKKRVEPYANNAKYKFELTVGDATGELSLKYWGDTNRERVTHLHELVQEGSILYVSGRVGEWQNRPEIRVNPEDQFRVCGEGEYEPADFLPVSKRDRHEMLDQLRGRIASVTDVHLTAVLSAVFNGTFLEMFARSPASLYKHHNVVGGLLEHTLGVVEICWNLAERYPFLDRNLLITGALLHDIGKVRGFKVTTTISRTAEGILLGHSTLGLEILDSALASVEIPIGVAHQLRHIMVSSLGGYGGLQKPAFPEALAISHAKAIDTRLSMMQNLRNGAASEGQFIYDKDFGQILVGQ